MLPGGSTVNRKYRLSRNRPAPLGNANGPCASCAVAGRLFLVERVAHGPLRGARGNVRRDLLGTGEWDLPGTHSRGARLSDAGGSRLGREFVHWGKYDFDRRMHREHRGVMPYDVHRRSGRSGQRDWRRPMVRGWSICIGNARIDAREPRRLNFLRRNLRRFVSAEVALPPYLRAASGPCR